MATLTNLSANSLKYYINSRRLKSAFCFFNIEIPFLRKLIVEYVSLLIEKDQEIRLKEISISLAKIVDEKKVIFILLEHQLKNLELLAEKRSVENKEELAAKQACLESHALDWLKKYHQLKTDFFLIAEPLIAIQ